MQAPSPYPHPHFRLFFACLLFLFNVFMLTGSGPSMFTDTDPIWHLMSGDLIRQEHTIPLSDPWSFTAGNYRWLNIAWAWDILLSLLHSYNGWHAAMALNAITIAATASLIFTTSLTRSRHFLPALLATVGAISLFSLSLRPLQISNLMVALWLLMLGSILRHTISPRWLLLFPFLTLLWVNSHGGFIMAPLLLAAFTLQSALNKNPLTLPLFLTTIASTATLFANPYGPAIIEAAYRPLTTIANRFIHEWEPFTFSLSHVLGIFDVFIFLLLAFTPRLPLFPAERALALLWCALSFTANRYLTIFAILAAPTVACALAHWFAPLQARTTTISSTLLKAYDRKPLAYAFAAASLLAIMWLPTPSAATYFHQEDAHPPQMPAAIAFMQSHPTRYLTHFNLATRVTYETQGKIPVFIDPRTETAFPPDVMMAYYKFHKSLPGWESILETYNIGGVVLPAPGKDPESDAIIQRFKAMPGWYTAFTGPMALIFLRQEHISR